MRSIILNLLLLVSTAAVSQPTSASPFKNTADLGNPATAGTSVFDPVTQQLTITAAGSSVNKPSGHWSFSAVKGDFILTAEVSIEATLTPGQSVGIRAESSGLSVIGSSHSDGISSLKWAATGSQGGEVKSIKQGYSILQLERERNRFILRAAHPGEPLQDIGEFQDKVGSPEMKIGLFTLSTGTTNTITFRNIRLDQPVSDTYDPDKEGHLGSRLELISISDRHRTVIHTSDQRFEAPNFMPDGKKLLFNQDGSLFTISTAGGVTEKFNTGFANRNNNDHVISFDGKLLGISHHREGMPGFGSTVYYLPIAGGEPILVTPETPSYLHGWSADNKAVVYVAQRNGSSQYHIYRKPIDGGPEVQLTFHKNGHVDGPEYSPDGQWIYYNGSQSGTMQLWRMRPDGTGNEQLTFDERNNWFPHLSPDGKWIAYLSFPPTINPNDHPSYKRVTLNLMPVNGGAPSVIAYLYGGQGTINVPSWSPDSSTIAFVSNSTKKISSK